jgi:large subunit ribosomal protein L15
MYQLNNLKPATGARRKRKRVGRGIGSGHGKTSTRGMKGHSSRSGGGAPAWFEGGQMPLYRRIPKRGFHSPNRIPYQVLNLRDLARFDAKATIDPDYLSAHGAVSGREPRVKLLGVGDVSGAYHVRVHAISESARKKIEAAGGNVELLDWTATTPEPAKPEPVRPEKAK